MSSTLARRRGVIAGLAVFSPLDLSPAAWFDASDASTITESSGAVSQLDDKSGNGLHLTQATASAKPTTGATVLNSLNVLDFDGGDVLAGATASDWKFLHVAAGHSIFAVWKPGNIDNPNTIYALLGTCGVSSGNVGTDAFLDDRDTQGFNDRIRHFVAAGLGGGNVPIENISADNALNANQWHYTTFLADPDNGTAAARSDMHVDGGAAIANNADTSSPSSSNPTHVLSLGAAGGGGNKLVGSIAEVILCDRKVTATEKADVESYFVDKWGL